MRQQRQRGHGPNERRRVESVEESAPPPGRAQGEIDQRELSTGAGARGANSQARRQRGATIGHPDGDGPAGRTSPVASARTAIRPVFFGIEFRVPSRTRGARRIAAGPSVCGPRKEPCGGPGLGEILRPGATRRFDGASSPASQRQAGAGSHRTVPPSRDDAERGRCPAGRFK